MSRRSFKSYAARQIYWSWRRDREHQRRAQRQLEHAYPMYAILRYAVFMVFYVLFAGTFTSVLWDWWPVVIVLWSPLAIILAMVGCTIAERRRFHRAAAIAEDSNDLQDSNDLARSALDEIERVRLRLAAALPAMTSAEFEEVRSSLQAMNVGTDDLEPWLATLLAVRKRRRMQNARGES